MPALTSPTGNIWACHVPILLNANNFQSTNNIMFQFPINFGLYTIDICTHTYICTVVWTYGCLLSLCWISLMWIPSVTQNHHSAVEWCQNFRSMQNWYIHILYTYIVHTCICTYVPNTYLVYNLHLLISDRVGIYFCRYGHSSCQLQDGRVLVTGGYGSTSKEEKTPHSRLDDVMLLERKWDLWDFCNLTTHGTPPGTHIMCVPYTSTYIHVHDTLWYLFMHY